MRSIKNLTASPLRVSLPGGKTLHLGPNESGSIRDPAAEHPAVKKLVEAGQIELGAGASTTAGGADGSGRAHGGAAAHTHSSAARKSGDR